jgi:hypothetical protein
MATSPALIDDDAVSNRTLSKTKVRDAAAPEAGNALTSSL